MVHSAPRKEDITALIEMGFEESLVKEALRVNDNNKERATEWILTTGSSQKIVPYGPMPESNARAEDDELSRAIAMSMMENQPNNQNREVRNPSLPLGLKNIGNIPYFTSLIQLLHSVPKFRETILNYNSASNIEDPHRKKLAKLLSELKSLFVLIDTSKNKFEDSNHVFAAYTEIDGAYQIDNKTNDVSDYLLKIISRVEEGLRYSVQDNDSVPVRKDSLSFLLENSIISDLFYGKMIPVTSFKNLAGKREKKQGSEVLFGKIEIEADHKELYEAWGKAMSKKIENYSIGENTFLAKQTSWIHSLPKLLIFDIKRQQFDQQGNLTKNKKAFAFPETLHPGRFIFENQSSSSKLQKSLRANKRKVRNLENSIEKFEKFNGTDLNISKMLSLCSDFLENQESGPDILANDFEQIIIKEKNPEEIKSAHKLINTYSEKVESVLSGMKSELINLTNQIESAFNTEIFNSFQYELVAVVIHDGDIGSGQFYSYMKNAGKWMKYQDINVNEVNFKEVMFHSLGEYGISAACCLVYSQVV